MSTRPHRPQAVSRCSWAASDLRGTNTGIGTQNCPSFPSGQVQRRGGSSAMKAVVAMAVLTKLIVAHSLAESSSKCSAWSNVPYVPNVPQDSEL